MTNDSHLLARGLPERSLALMQPEVAAQWHPTKNLALTPLLVNHSSAKRAWWLGECGHEWQASISNRAHGARCPFCFGMRALAGFNDLGTTHPDLAADWHPTKNGDLTAKHVRSGSVRSVWWQAVCGHHWEARPLNRTRQDQGCPFCSGRRTLAGFNDLSTTHTGLAGEWHPSKNGTFLPTSIGAGCNRVVWWLGDCAHIWAAPVTRRVAGHGCPFCSGNTVLAGFNDLASLHPTVASLWHPTKNGHHQADSAGYGSKRKVWWLGLCGHEWPATITSQVAGHGCPVCCGRTTLEGFNDLATLYPELGAQWHPTRNGDLSPNQVTVKSHKKVWWHGRCGHDWNAAVAARSNGTGCPKCPGKPGAPSGICERLITALATTLGPIVMEYEAHIPWVAYRPRLAAKLDGYGIYNGVRFGIEYDGHHHATKTEVDLRKTCALFDHDVIDILIRVRCDRIALLNDADPRHIQIPHHASSRIDQLAADVITAIHSYLTPLEAHSA